MYYYLDILYYKKKKFSFLENFRKTKPPVQRFQTSKENVEIFLYMLKVTIVRFIVSRSN